MSSPRKSILICSQDRMFVKGIYGPLRDAGYDIETGEHPNDAVRSVLHSSYSSVILDSGDFGMNAADAAAIIRNLRPDIHIILIGNGPDDPFTVSKAEAFDHIVELLAPLDKAESLQTHFK